MDKSKVQSKDRFEVWLSQAKHDLDLAEYTMEFKSYEWVCYQSIQSVEKIFKAVIVHSGYRPPKTHKLGVLVSMCNRANPSFVNIKLNFRKIEGYTFISRYPFVIPGQNVTPHELIKKHDAEACLEIAKGIYKTVYDFLKYQKPILEDENDLRDYYFSADEFEDRKSRLIDVIVNCDKLKVEKIILFGSFARESVLPKSSTMDLLIVAHTELSFVERIHYVRDITKGGEPIVEPLIYTPEEFRFMVDEEGEGFLESAIEEGKVLWERGNNIFPNQQDDTVVEAPQTNPALEREAMEQDRK